MNMFVTFGHGHNHVINGVMISGPNDAIELCNVQDYSTGRELVFKLFGPKFCTTYDKKPRHCDVVLIIDSEIMVK